MSVMLIMQSLFLDEIENPQHINERFTLVSEAE